MQKAVTMLASMLVLAMFSGIGAAHTKFYDSAPRGSLGLGEPGVSPVPSCAGSSVAYVGSSTVVVRDGNSDQTVVDDAPAPLACTPGGGPTVGGGFIPFSAGNTITVVDSLFGTGVAFQVCIDNDADSDCHAGPPENPCPDSIFFSHSDGGAFFNPLGPLPLGFSSGTGCPTIHGFEGYVVFICEGVHNDLFGPHEHGVTEGDITGTVGGGALGGNFCGTPPPPVHAGSGVKRYVAPGAFTGTIRSLLLDCGDGSDPVLNRSTGGVCFGTKSDGFLPQDYPTDSDCVPAFSGPLDPTGECTITIVDDFFSPAAALYCQDLNDDLFCGGQPTDSPTGFTEPRTAFCDSITINTPLDATPRAEGLWVGGPASDPSTTWVTNNWDPDRTIYVLFFGPDRGNPALPGPCGPFVQQTSNGFGTHS